MDAGEFAAARKRYCRNLANAAIPRKLFTGKKLQDMGVIPPKPPVYGPSPLQESRADYLDAVGYAAAAINSFGISTKDAEAAMKALGVVSRNLPDIAEPDEPEPVADILPLDGKRMIRLED